MSSLIWRLGGWVFPHRPFVALENRHRRKLEAERYELETREGRRLAAPNAELRGLHRGKRCFILCNGPTVRKQNLRPLKGEVVFSVSNGYHHPDFSVFTPRYHCVPQVTYGRLNEEDVIRWFNEMHEKLGDAELFLSTTEEKLVRTHRLFPGRNIHYVLLYDRLEDRLSDTIPDIAGPIPRVQSVPIMVLMTALYMGFIEIYLLGTDHDHFLTGEYKYFYEPTVLRGKDVSTDASGRLVTTRYDDFHELGHLWRQYRAIRNIANANDVKIWNATAGGALDEFPRVKLEDVVLS